MFCFVLRVPWLLTKGLVCAQTLEHVCMWSKYSFLLQPKSLCAMGKVIVALVFPLQTQTGFIL